MGVEAKLASGAHAVDMYASLGLPECVVVDYANLKTALVMLLEFCVKFAGDKPVVMSVRTEDGKLRVQV